MRLRSSTRRKAEEARSSYDSDEEEDGSEKVIERSGIDKFFNYLFCRSDLAKQKLKLQPVSFTGLFRHANRADHIMLLFGATSSIISGCFQPTLALVSGGILNVLLTEASSPNFRSDAYVYVYIYLAMGIGITFFNFMNYFLFDRVCSRIMGRMRQEFIRSILRQDAGWYDKNHAGALITQLNDNMERIREGVGDKLGLLLRGLTMFVGSLVVAFSVEWRLALFMSLLAPSTCLIMGIMAQKLAKSTAKELREVGRAGAIAEEAVLGVRTVQAFNGQEEMVGRYETELGKGKQHALKKSLWSGLFGGMFFFILQSYNGCGMLFGGYLLSQGLVREPGNVFTVVMAMMISAYFLGIVSPHLMVLLNARVAAAIVYKTIDRIPKIDAYHTGGMTPSTCFGRLEFKNVHFRYPTRKDTKVLNGFSLVIEPGETVAFVGHSGCGKSTAVGLLTRLYEAEAGEVLIDGNEVRQLNLEWLRQHIGIVQQEPILFNDTLAENLKMGKEDITRDEMQRVCRQANAHAFVQKLPNGYDTHIGDGGVQLSGGQKQRIAIARTLARNPRILLLDEATSALDAESESIVQAALDNARLGRTTILIAHRLSTVRNADKIVVFEKGTILEAGTHAELLKSGGRYSELVNAQRIDGELDDPEVNDDVTEKIDPDSIPALPVNATPRRYSIDTGRAAFKRGVRVNDSFLRQSTRAGNMELAEGDAFVQRINETYAQDEVVSPDLIRVIRYGGYEAAAAVITAMIRGLELPGASMAFGLVFHAFDLYTTENDSPAMMRALYPVLATYVGVGTMVFIAHFIASVLFGRASERVTMDCRVQSMRNILYQDAAYFDNPRHAPGRLITRLATDAPNMKAVLDARVMTVIYNLTAWVVCGIIAFTYAWPMGVLGTVLSILLGCTMILLSRKIQRINLALAKKSEAGRLSIEIVESVRTIQLLTREQRFMDKYSVASNELRSSDAYRGRFESASFAMSQSFVYYTLAANYSLGIYLIYMQYFVPNDVYRCSTAMLLACIAIMQSSSFFPELVKARTASALMFNIMDRKCETGDIHAGREIKLQGNLHFANVKFSYPQRPHQPILRSLNFTAERGQTVALVGPSGAGKSSVISLMERMYDIAGGFIMFDGTNLKDASLRCVRSQMALVGQEPRLFAGSIRDNVKFGLAREVTDQEIMKALETANAKDFISKMPQGLDTDVGERGTQLSGGQKQRIAIARALVRDPTILLLDEATSALDTESEKMVQEALEKAAGGRTCITIAHRLSSIQNADKIVYIEAGKVLESGTHAQLLALKGRYYKLVKRQDMTS